MNIKDVLIDFRKRKGLSQAAVARRLNVRQSAVANWESGYRIPNLQSLIKLEILTEGEIKAKEFSPQSFKLEPYSVRFR